MLTGMPIPDESIYLRTKFPPLPPHPLGMHLTTKSKVQMCTGITLKGGFPNGHGWLSFLGAIRHRGRAYWNTGNQSYIPSQRAGLGDCNIRTAPCCIPKLAPINLLFLTSLSLIRVCFIGACSPRNSQPSHKVPTRTGAEQEPGLSLSS